MTLSVYYMVMNTLYLTGEEEASFRLLPAAIRKGCSIEEETLVRHYETTAQINMRFRISDFKKFPDLAPLMERLKEDGELSAANFEVLGPALQQELFFAIGARGVAGLLLSILPKASTREDIEAIAHLSQIRHALLEINSRKIPVT